MKNLILDLYFLLKNTQLKKKRNSSNQSPDEGDLIDLKISVVETFFGVASLWRKSIHSGAKYEESNCKSRLFVKKYPIKKKNQWNWSPDEGDIVDLKSAFSANLCDDRTVAVRIGNSSG